MSMWMDGNWEPVFRLAGLEVRMYLSFEFWNWNLPFVPLATRNLANTAALAPSTVCLWPTLWTPRSICLGEMLLNDFMDRHVLLPSSFLRFLQSACHEDGLALDIGILGRQALFSKMQSTGPKVALQPACSMWTASLWKQ